MIAMQLVTFSAFFISGWAIEVSQRGMFLPINEGLFSTEGGLGLFLVRCWFYAFAGQLIRDFAVVGCTNSLIAAHHIVCLIGICLMLASPCGGVLMASGPYFLELGSMVYNAWCVDLTMRAEAYADLGIPWPRAPESRLVHWSYVVGMSLSNFAGAAALIATAAVLLREQHPLWAIFFVTLAVPLIFMRQLQCYHVLVGDVPPPPPALVRVLKRGGSGLSSSAAETDGDRLIDMQVRAPQAPMQTGPGHVSARLTTLSKQVSSERICV
eukprot:CAMPEP_0174733452 /NCGR_PEP_ID=MMETSP1094-20130205/61334_1 /TAXON_ID=156173 /ORGANISM="Chrysochromulina brevifilum, Strain UTEX LB 985" /LENGTH=267 /DNA_ID=CAMNT_0015936109 /DNA_START=165 /DNA_END=968 /DNA_ORIENTATION=-